MSRPEEEDTDDYCGNCGGEGFTYHCVDGCCEYAEEGCELCASRCDWCNPRKPAMPDTASPARSSIRSTEGEA